MNKKDLKKAIKNGQCIIVIDNNDVEVRYAKNEDSVITKYDVKPLSVERVEEVIADTVKSCLSLEGKVQHYFVENNIIRAILNEYTTIPDDTLDENDIEMLINANGIVWACDGNSFITRFRKAIREHLGVINGRNKRSNEFTRFLNQIFVPFENEEIGEWLRNVVVDGVMSKLSDGDEE